MSQLIQNDKTPRMRVELLEHGNCLSSYITDGEDRLILGSSKQADLILPKSDASHIHAMLKVINDQIYVYDLGSTEGTFVNGKKIIESKILSGTSFRIGVHELRVAILQKYSNSTDMPEHFLFWNAKPITANSNTRIDINYMLSGELQNQYEILQNSNIKSGWKKNQIPLSSEKGVFLSLKNNLAKCKIPKNYQANIYNYKNELIKTLPSGEINFVSSEKIQLIGPNNSEIQLYWRASSPRLQRTTTQDTNDKIAQRSLILSTAFVLIIAISMNFFSSEQKNLEETTIPKSSYFRLSTDSQATASVSTTETTVTESITDNSNSTINNTFSKLLQKKSVALNETAIAQAISNNGTQSVRANALIANSSLKQQNIPSNTGVSSGINANTITNSLQKSGANGAGKNLTGFTKNSGGIGGATGAGLGSGGNGFNLNIGSEEAEAIGGLDKALIAAVVQANIGQIKHCYEKQLLIDPNIYGKIVMDWVIASTGLVNKAAVKKTTMNNTTVENCIATKIKGWKFPQPKGGGNVIVTYPFLFKSLN